MPLHRKLHTQTEDYWQSEYDMSGDDFEFIYAAMLEDGQPRSLPDLIELVMRRRYEEEAELIARQASEGQMYRPREAYEVGQRLIFQPFDYRMGTVVGSRTGNNPKYGEFTVLQVQLDGSRRMREFAADLQVDHALNDVSDLGIDEDFTVDELYQRFGHWAQPHIEAALEDSEEFISHGELWFLREFLPEVHIGHLNIVEALIDEARTPLGADEMLKELDIPPRTTREALVFALNHALTQDERFDDVSTSGEPLWYLVTLEPPAITQRLPRLEPDYATEIGALLHRESLELVEEVGDEWDQVEGALVGGVKPVDSISFILTYPHLREGTMPINWKMATLLPDSQNPRIRITLVDRGNREEMAVWAVPGWRYAAGLGEWYRKHDIPVGAIIQVSRTDDPFTLQISVQPQRRKGEWVRSLGVVNGALDFEIQRRAYTCKYDKNVLLGDAEEEGLDQIWAEMDEKSPSILEVLRLVFPELAKLNAQGMVHAKALYSAVNTVRRVGMVPILACLARQACFDPVGDGNWVIDPSLIGKEYRTPDEVKDRPYSKRSDLVQHQVFRYSGF